MRIVAVVPDFRARDVIRLESMKTCKPPVAEVELGRQAVLTCLLVRDAVYGRKVSTIKEIAGGVA